MNSMKMKMENNKKCDICGETITGKTFPVTDENFNTQKGVLQCEKCFSEQCLGNDEIPITNY